MPPCFCLLSLFLSLSLPPSSVCKPVLVYIMSQTAVVSSVCLLSMMKALPILVLLSSVAQFCGAVEPLQPVTCAEDGSAAAARLATHHINRHHDHGYKFKLDKVNSTDVEKVDDGCNIELHLDLIQTKCHTVNPKHFEDCDTPKEEFRAVMANCTVTITIKDSDVKVTKYDCDTRRVHTNREMVMRCPDCPTLIPLNSPEGLQTVTEAVAKFNENSTLKHIYVLQEVASVLSTWIPTTRMNYYPEFVIVESHCPWGTKINPRACKPLCPERAHHAFCSAASSATGGLMSLECEVYPPTNTTDLGPGEFEPICRPPHPPPGPPPHAHGPPPHAGGPPPHAGGPPPHAGGPPPHAGGPPPHPGGHGRGHGHGHGHGAPPIVQQSVQHRLPFHPPHTFDSCHGVLTDVDPALHPICPWPLPDPRPNPRPSAD